jgi:hypothetical protein
MRFGRAISGLRSRFLRFQAGNGARPANVRVEPAMALFLLTFNRQTRDVDVVEITDHDEGMTRLFEAERRLRYEPNLEIVMLAAEDEDDLRQTHSRYFESVEELLAD